LIGAQGIEPCRLRWSAAPGL